MAQQRRKDKKTVRSLVPQDLFVQHLRAETREEAIAELLNVLVVHGFLDLTKEREVRDAILDREKVASTGIGNGIAIPHAKSKFAEKFAAAIGISHEGVDFAAHDGMPAFVVALWILPPAATKQHLGFMRGLATIARDANLAGTLAGCKDKKGFLHVLDQVPVEEKSK